MNYEQEADALLRRAVEDGQSSHPLKPGQEAEAIREAVRRLARAKHIRIRTGHVEGKIVVVLTSSSLWSASTAVMRSKLGL